jgi:spermidine synthase
MKSRLLPAATLVFGSGFCALLYQTTWLREFRLIFGSSTAASAAVVGIFMGGLGLGSALLGRRAEKTSRPLGFYARLELGIAVSAALTPTLITLARAAYIACGGTLTLGIFAGTCLRLVLAALVLGTPTLLMGGTLPAMARFAVTDADENRRGLALLYGMNTLGAVAGAIIGTFLLLESLGDRATLYFSCALNASVAVTAWLIARGELAQSSPAISPNELQEHVVSDSRIGPHAIAPVPMLLGCAALTGFVFLLMELVWYRMLSPILGGTAFTFGLILAVALLGIGSGGVAYSIVASDRRPTLHGFASTCALEALFLAVPYGLGDRIALCAMLLQPLASLGFHGRVIGWLALCAIVVFPAAFIAGIQFPLLLGLLGKGRDGVGAQTGAAYAWNTAGAIAGSLAGGFGLIPIFSATGTWRLVIALLAACAFLALLAGRRTNARPWRALPALGAVVVAVFILIFAEGPTAAWRHGQLDRMNKFNASRNEIRDLLQSLRRDILWQADGVESSIGISKTSALAFIVNGKCDGNAKSDAGTQVMVGLLGALSHPNAKRAAVIGLGTGSTAGWLAAVPSIQQVDVMELEPVMKKFAGQCASVNHDALASPKLKLIFGDARELLLTNRDKYDLIVSEPSNPYRAGVASLFTREFYQTVAAKLNPGGLFAQWLQAYDVDLRTVRIFYATFGAVFPHIETWQTQAGDLLLIGSQSPIVRDFAALRARVAEEPFRSAIASAWETNNLEGVFTHYIGNDEFARNVTANSRISLNTDDRMLLEFAFARNRQTDNRINFAEMRELARSSGADRLVNSDALDWGRIDLERIAFYPRSGRPTELEIAGERLADALAHYENGDLAEAWTRWQSLQREPRDIPEFRLVAECLAERGDDGALRYIDKLQPSEADAIRARLFWRQRRPEEAVIAVTSALQRFHLDPWPSTSFVTRTINLAIDLIQDRGLTTGTLSILRQMQEPFAVYNDEGVRAAKLVRAALALDRGPTGEHVLHAVAAFEPHVPWELQFLSIRSRCYTAAHDTRADDARCDLLDFIAAEPGGVEGAHFAKAGAPARVADASSTRDQKR